MRFGNFASFKISSVQNFLSQIFLTLRYRKTSDMSNVIQDFKKQTFFFSYLSPFEIFWKKKRGETRSRASPYNCTHACTQSR